MDIFFLAGIGIIVWTCPFEFSTAKNPFHTSKWRCLRCKAKVLIFLVFTVVSNNIARRLSSFREQALHHLLLIPRLIFKQNSLRHDLLL